MRLYFDGNGGVIPLPDEVKVIPTEVEKSVMPWNVLGKLDDGTYKGKCGNCGFVHYFIEGHDAQYKFCPQCGEQKLI